MDNPAEAFLRLSREDLSVLSSIEAGMMAHEWVPIQEIARQSGLSLRKVEYRLRILSEQKLVTRTTIHYEGYQIDFDAYDLLAISDLLKRDFITCIGDKIGVGKESVVYEALGQSPLVIKFHRQGRTSFKHVRRARDHLTDLPRLPWLHAASLAARHEFQVMQRLYPEVSVPRPVALSRHALAMELIYGDQLNKVVLTNPKDCLETILDEVGKTYRLGIVHADLSEFNVMVTAEGLKLKIIDWPQAVETDHPNATQLLERDVSNVLKFFVRRYKIDLPLEEAISRVKSTSVSGAGQEAALK
ncbi:MAG TPA: RIO1 family regulatory kinase/ATPase [Methanotrichaceae archaeon]|nr:RIO1 family regulatory kinase/ATPase [Methanotrichaceae archaeon]